MMTKIQFAVLAIVFLFSSFALPASVPAVESDNEAVSPSFSLYRLAGCRVSTRGGNLNVRNNAGHIIARLTNGTYVTIVKDDGDRFLISAYVGRRTIRGWVSSEFVTCN